MKSFAAITLIALAGLGLASPIEQQESADCSTCRESCLFTASNGVGYCYLFPQSVCDIYRGVSLHSPFAFIYLI